MFLVFAFRMYAALVGLADGSRSHRETLNLLCTPCLCHIAMAYAYLYSDGFTLGFLPRRDNLRRLGCNTVVPFAK